MPSPLNSQIPNINPKLPLTTDPLTLSSLTKLISTSSPSDALRLFTRLLCSGAKPDPFLLSATLKSSPNSTPSIHALSFKTGLNLSIFVATSLLTSYSKSTRLAHALQVFDEMPERNVVTWTATITALMGGHRAECAIQCFRDMHECLVPADSQTFAVALKACAGLGWFNCGREIHARALKVGLGSVPFVSNSLCALYGKCRKAEMAIQLFERMRAPDVVSWTTVISSLCSVGRGEEALEVFVRMMRSCSARPNAYTFAAVIVVSRVEFGEQLHSLAVRIGVAGSLSTANATLTMYSKSGRLKAAEIMFRDMEIRDVISWSAIVSAYSEEGVLKAAFAVFSNMRRSGFDGNEYVLASLLSSCARMVMLEQGRQVHASVVKAGLELEPMISSTLVNMYSKCGCIEEAQVLFDLRGFDNVVSWTAMIDGYAEHGSSAKAIALFERMRVVGLQPDSVTFIGVLSACSHAGLLDLGLKYFDLMKDEYGIHPEKEHYGCMVDLLCRAGRLDDAERMIERMPYHPDDIVWSTLLQASRIHGNPDSGRRAAEKLLELNSSCAGTLVTLSNIYAAKGRWREAADVRLLMRSRGARKEPGWSWITVGENVSVFVARDRKHPASDEIYNLLYLMAPRAKIGGLRSESLKLVIDEEENLDFASIGLLRRSMSFKQSFLEILASYKNWGIKYHA